VKNIHKIQLIIILLLCCYLQNICAQDSVTVASPVKHRFKPETIKATMMAVSFPGLGQIYNRKIWKIPVVYAGFGTLIYFIKFNGNNYNTYLKAYQDFTDKIPQTNSYLKVISPDVPQSIYDPVVYPKTATQDNYAFYQQGILRLVDYYKRYRDLSYIGIAGWYLISILDANVDASLFNYDVSPNLDLTLVPVQMALPGGYVGAGLSVDLKINF